MNDDSEMEAPNLKRRLREASEEERTALVEGLPYDVGFGKPPRQTRFKRGQSGNRKGRPKGAPNFWTIFDQELGKTVEVNENGKRRKMTKLQVGLRQLVNKLASGDPKAATTVTDLMRKTGKFDDVPAPIAPAVDQRDLLTVSSLLEFFKTSNPTSSDDESGRNNDR